MSITTLFSTEVYYRALARKQDTDRLNKELLEEIELFYHQDEEGQLWSSQHYLGGYTSYQSIANLHQRTSTFMELRERIDRHVAQYVESLEYDMRGKTLYMSDCWANVMPTGTVHSGHIHPLSFISGTYYVDTPEGSSSIKFEDPRLTSFMATPPRKQRARKHHQPFVTFSAEAGKIVLFESWLRHEVPPSEVQGERVSVSFNYQWCDADN